jgi:hypothetical protein
MQKLADVLPESDLAFRVRQIKSSPSLPDSKLVFAVGKATSRAILLLSPQMYPSIVAQEQDKAARMKEHLGEELGSVILKPLAEGYIANRSYALIPMLKPLSKKGWLKRLQYWSIKPSLLDWIQAVNEKRSVGWDQAPQRFTDSLRFLCDLAQADNELRIAADSALNRLSSGKFHPRVVPAHNDLWIGNVLRSGSSCKRYPISIIDWQGSEIKGVPVYDLVRACMSLRLSPSELGAQIIRATRRLDCDPTDSICYTLAALGSIASRQDQFPADRFRRLAAQCLAKIRDAKYPRIY